MRALTPQEIADAPEGSTHYMVSFCGVVTYAKGAPTNYSVIPRKEFDISGYEFSDNAVYDLDVDSDLEGLSMGVYNHSDGDAFVGFSRNDIIAMAKALKLTPEDLTGKSS